LNKLHKPIQRFFEIANGLIRLTMLHGRAIYSLPSEDVLLSLGVYQPPSPKVKEEFLRKYGFSKDGAYAPGFL